MEQQQIESLHKAFVYNEVDNALNILEQEIPPDINEYLYTAIYYGNLEVFSKTIEYPKIDCRILNMNYFLEQALRLKQFEIVSYLVDRTDIDEEGLNIILYSKAHEENINLYNKTKEKFRLIHETDQQQLWYKASRADLEGVKTIVESKNYYDLFPALFAATNNNNIEVVIYLFEETGNKLRYEQIKKLLFKVENESQQWLEKRILQNTLMVNLKERKDATKLKI